MQVQAHHDYTPLTDRMNALLGLRVVMTGFILVQAAVRPEVSAVLFSALVALSVSFLATSFVLEGSRRRSGRRL